MVLDEKRMEPSACHFYHFVITEYDRRGQMKKSMYLSEGKNISAFLCNRKVPITQKALRAGCDQMHMEYDCLWQSASGTQSGLVRFVSGQGQRHCPVKRRFTA